LPFKWFLVLVAAKVVGMSIVSGTLFSYVALFSLAGTMVSALMMRGVRRVGRQAVSLVGVSIAGAVASNATQMLIARFVIFGEVAWLIAPLFLLTGLITGTLMGFFAEYFVEHSNWYAYATGASEMSGTEDGSDTGLGADSADDGLWGGAHGGAGRIDGIGIGAASSEQTDAQDGTERRSAKKASRSVRAGATKL